MKLRISAAMLTAITMVTASGAASLAQPPAPPPAAAAQPPAETPASTLARRLLQAAGQSDEAFLAFMHEANPKSQRPDGQWVAFRQQIKTLQVHGLEQASATHAELSVFDTGVEMWARLILDVTDTTPPTIKGLAVRLGRPPADVAPTPRLAPAALAAATREHAATAAREDRFSGAVLIARNGKPILEEAYGLADREAKTPNTTQTQFRFGSMGKMFTAVSIMQLVQAGKLDLTAPIGRYLKDYPNQDIATKVTIDNLLTHTGGTGDIFTPEFMVHRLDLKDPKDYVALFGARAPKFAPGAQTEYSNYGFMLMGRIVEVVSGQSYDDYIAGHVFAPAHMTSTGNQPETTRLPRRATGYMDRGGKLASASDTQPWRGTPAGGGYSTVGDLAKFADALMANRLLDAAHTKLLTTGGITGPSGQLLRYDFGAPADDGRRFFGHSGGAPGMNGELRIFPATPGHEAYTVVVLANRDPPVATGLSNFISNRLP
ncbi:MAG: serine hydrolase domain-containing protein [Phenylobacterium sp.]